jgi:hypothetical protein
MSALNWLRGEIQKQSATISTLVIVKSMMIKYIRDETRGAL